MGRLSPPSGQNRVSAVTVTTNKIWPNCDGQWVRCDMPNVQVCTIKAKVTDQMSENCVSTIRETTHQNLTKLHTVVKFIDNVCHVHHLGMCQEVKGQMTANRVSAVTLKLLN